MARIGYARVSTGDQNLDQQVHRLTEAGCEQVFRDRGFSGTQASRPGWDKLLEQLEPGDTVVCVKLDRIGRSVVNLYDIAQLLDQRQAGLICLDQPVDTTDAIGKLLFGMLAVIAQFEKDLIVERTRDGQLRVRRERNLRKSLGGPPVLGFRDDGGDDKRDWTLDPVQAGWLAGAAQLVLGDPEHNVDAAFRALPPVTDSAGRPVTAKMLRAALQRPASAGLIVTDGQVTGTADIGGPLDEDTYRRLKVLFGGRKLGRPVEAGRYPFGPLLRCGKCGNQLTGQPGWKGRPYYACANPHKIGGVMIRPCKGVSVPAEDIHTLIDGAMQQWAATPLARAAAAREPATASRRAEVQADLGTLSEQLADIDAKRFRMRNQPGARARYDALAAEAEQLIDAASAELDALDAIDAEPGVPWDLGLDWDAMWDAMTPAEKRATLAEAYQTPIDVAPGNGGARALSAADRIDLFPRTPQGVSG